LSELSDDDSTSWWVLPAKFQISRHF
jgi:hypothetical protein